MNKCRQCKYYKFDRMIHFYKNSPETGIGHCTKFSVGVGDLTYAVNEACEFFEQYAVVFKKWDTFVHPDNGVITIESIVPDTAPRIYRVSTHHYGGYSISEQELKDEGWKLIYSEKKGEDE